MHLSPLANNFDEDEEEEDVDGDVDGDGGAVYDDGSNEEGTKSLYVSSFTSAFLQIGEAEGGFMAVSLASLKHNTGWRHGEIWFRGSYIRRPRRTGCLKVP